MSLIPKLCAKCFKHDCLCHKPQADAAREWWIYDAKKFTASHGGEMEITGGFLFAKESEPEAAPCPVVHVIERSAYDRMVRELAQTKQFEAEFERQLTLSEKRSVKLLSALKFYASGQHAISEFNDGGRAREAIREYEEGK